MAKVKPHAFEHGEAVKYMNYGEARGLLSPGGSECAHRARRADVCG